MSALRARKPDSQQSKAGKVLAIASGKGGVGKTWLSLNLAYALAGLGRRVLLIDADFGLANIDVQIGLNARYDLGHVLDGVVSCKGALNHYGPGRFDVLPGRSGCTRVASLDPAALMELLEAFTSIAQGYDHVLVDLGAGIDRRMRQIAAWADTLLVLLTDEPTSLTDAYAVLKLHLADSRAKDARLVINLASSETNARQTATALQRACKHFLSVTPPCAGMVRRSNHVPDSIRRQALSGIMHPNSPASIDIGMLAAGLYAECPL